MSSVLASGLLCGLWAFIAPVFGLFTWAGFAGCTTFFAIGKGDVNGLLKAILCNLTGFGCALLIIWLSEVIPIPYGVAIFSGLVTALMCLLGRLKMINYIPGIFIGCFSTFAANGDWMILLLSLFSGAVLGFCCFKLAEQFSKIYERHTKHTEISYKVGK